MRDRKRHLPTFLCYCSTIFRVMNYCKFIFLAEDVDLSSKETTIHLVFKKRKEKTNSLQQNRIYKLSFQMKPFLQAK